MSTRPTAPRARHAFPRSRAALLLLLRGGLHSTRWARRTFDFSSAWTTAVVAGMLGLAVLIGVTESVMARLRLLQVPVLLVASCLLSGFGIILVAR